MLSMNGSEEERLSNWNTMEAKNYIVHDVFLVAYFIAGLTGNIAVLLVYKTKLKKESESRYFIPILAFADLCACTFRAPFELWKTLLPVNFQDIIGCQIVWFLVNVFTFASIYLLAVITFQRYLKVCRPFGPQMTLRWRRASLVIILLLSLVFSGPFIIWNEKLEIPNTALNVTGYICGANVLKIDDNSNSFLGFIFFVFLILVLVMVELIGLNGLIGRTIFIILKNDRKRRGELNEATKISWNQSTGQKEPSTSQTVEGSTGYSTDSTNTATHGDSNEKIDLNLKNKRDELSNAEANIKMEPGSNHKDSSRLFSYMFMVISLSFILSYIPQIFLLYSLFRDRYFWIKSSQVETIVYKFLDQMVMINNIVNPFVYGFFDKKFRSAAKALICCK